jgi:hypothetical protein
MGQAAALEPAGARGGGGGGRWCKSASTAPPRQLRHAGGPPQRTPEGKPISATRPSPYFCTSKPSPPLPPVCSMGTAASQSGQAWRGGGWLRAGFGRCAQATGVGSHLWRFLQLRAQLGQLGLQGAEVVPGARETTAAPQRRVTLLRGHRTKPTRRQMTAAVRKQPYPSLCGLVLLSPRHLRKEQEGKVRVETWQHMAWCKPCS